MSFNSISIRELPTWVKVLKNSPDIKTKEDMLSDLQLIDDLLTLQKAQSLLNRKKNLKKQLEARIAMELGHPLININTRT